MVRELKSLTQLHALVVSELRKRSELNGISPQFPLLRESDPSGCNWDIPGWEGPRNVIEKAAPQLTGLIGAIQSRYKAISIRR